jgi:hypothetical protein
LVRYALTPLAIEARRDSVLDTGDDDNGFAETSCELRC